MKLKSNFSSSLDFKPLNLWPETVPALALDKVLLCGFHLNDNHPVFEHSHSSPDSSLKLIKSIYPQLTLPELSRLIHSSAFEEYFQVDTLLKAYGFHSSPEILQVLRLLFESSERFQEFVSVKKMGPQELFPLLDLNSEELNFVREDILTAGESKQETVRRLELLSDLLQMGHSSDSLRNLKQSQLAQKRYPVTTERDLNLKAFPLPWLSQIRSQFKRRGDKAGFEVQFFAGTPAELNKMAQNLTKVAQEWNSKS